jgi:adenine-specific DNA-methyltransferase
VPFHLLKDVMELACGDPGDGNLIVQGDNLVALKALLPYYAGQVQCIDIAPPYNTGNEGGATTRISRVQASEEEIQIVQEKRR